MTKSHLSIDNPRPTFGMIDPTQGERSRERGPSFPVASKAWGEPADDRPDPEPPWVAEPPAIPHPIPIVRRIG
jgi:hypothetical protein